MSKKTFDVAALGELLIDFTQNGVITQGKALFEANPGGEQIKSSNLLSK
ncbi:hypothetical protein [Neobacillus cucumis]|nr:hypothetical protein [Neobacillus cucumis]MDR4949698.1 hypothetical protein [Neobacillus cucumis]